MKYMGVELERTAFEPKNSGLDSESIVELYTEETGKFGLVFRDSDSIPYSEDYKSYGQGVLETNILYESTTLINKLVIQELTNKAISSKGTVDISFDGGNSYSTGKIVNSIISSFSGTNSDDGTYKLKLKFSLGSDYNSGNNAWCITASLNEAKSGLGGCGTISSALCMGGSTGAFLDTTEIWNGSSWSTTSALNDSKDALASCGNSSTALCFGGNNGTYSDASEIWDGSSWVTTSALNEGKISLAGCGTVSNALCFGGYTSTGFADTTEIWNGSSWSTTSALKEVKCQLAGCGTVSNALCFGGFSATAINTTEIWNGSSWSTTSSLNAARANLSGCGNTSDALSFGGETTSFPWIVDTTEIWNGFSWSTTSALNEIRSRLAGCGTTSSALAFGALSDSIDTTERWFTTGCQLGFSVDIN